MNMIRQEKQKHKNRLINSNKIIKLWNQRQKTKIRKNFMDRKVTINFLQILKMFFNDQIYLLM